MSGRATGGRGLGRFVRKFEQEQTLPLFLQILPKKYHKDFISADINEETLHTMVNNIFEGMDIRDELEYYLDMPPRFRFVNVKQTTPLYEKLCKEYKKKHSITKTTPQQIRQKQKDVVKQKQIEKKIKLKCTCQNIV